MCNQFVKLSCDVLRMDIPAEAKLLYSILTDRVGYSQFEDDRGQYYFLSSNDREELIQIVGCCERSYKTYMKLLKDRGLIQSRHFGRGTRIYDSLLVQNLPEEMVQNLPEPLNQNTKPELQENYTDSEHNIESVHNTKEDNMENNQPTFIDVLAYWKEKGYHSSPADFFNRYSLQNWIIDGKPVYSWKKLADFWEGSEFTMPLYDCERVISSIPDSLKQIVIEEQEVSGGRIRQRTYEKIRNYL